MKTTGTIKKVLPVRTGTSKKGSTWAAQQFVLDTDGDGELLLEVFGQKEIDQYAITEGEKLTVTYVPKVHETVSPASSVTSHNPLQNSLWHLRV